MHAQAVCLREMAHVHGVVDLLELKHLVLCIRHQVALVIGLPVGRLTGKIAGRIYEAVFLQRFVQQARFLFPKGVGSHFNNIDTPLPAHQGVFRVLEFQAFRHAFQQQVHRRQRAVEVLGVAGGDDGVLLNLLQSHFPAFQRIRKGTTGRQHRRVERGLGLVAIDIALGINKLESPALAPVQRGKVVHGAAVQREGRGIGFQGNEIIQPRQHPQQQRRQRKSQKNLSVSFHKPLILMSFFKTRHAGKDEACRCRHIQQQPREKAVVGLRNAA